MTVTIQNIIDRIGPIKEGEILLLRNGTALASIFSHGDIAHLMREIGPRLAEKDAMLIVLREGTELSILDESTMNKNGWFRKNRSLAFRRFLWIVIFLLAGIVIYVPIYLCLSILFGPLSR